MRLVIHGSSFVVAQAYRGTRQPSSICCAYQLLTTLEGTRSLLRPASMNWSVYIILCTDNTLYTGITIDVTTRFKQHAAGRGAKYFRGRQPKRFVYIEPGHNRSSATKREINLKKMSREEKWRVIGSSQNNITEFF